MYVAVKGGERAIENAHRLLAHERRGDRDVSEISLGQIAEQHGWGTGGVQVTAAILGPDDVLKVIDQGSDDTMNAISIRKFFGKTAGVATTIDTTEAT